MNNEHATIRSRIFLVSWATYICAYICRVNISVALNDIKETFKSDMMLVGVMGSAFFVIYAVGQLVNGYLGDKLKPRRFIMTALIGTVFMNLIIGFSNSLTLITVCWGINGYFQSIFWGPLMRILSRLYGQSERRKISAGMSSTMVIGYIIAWTLLGRVLLFASWKWLFLIPSVIGVLMMVIWLVNTKKLEQLTVETRPKRTIKETLSFISERKLWFLMAACFFMGLIKEGITLWAPMIFLNALGLNISDSLSLLLILPVSNFIGIFIANRLHKSFGTRDLNPVIIMVSVIMILSLLLKLLFGEENIMSIILIAAISMMSFGSNTVFLSIIPLHYAKDNMVSSLVGVIDFSTYSGAAVSAMLTAFIVDVKGWGALPIVWLVAAWAALIWLLIQNKNSDINQYS